MSPHPLINKEAPPFTLPDANGETFTFPPAEGGKRIEKPTVIFFYPRSGTFGCTREACQFRDALAENEIFKQSDVQVIGISADPIAKQKTFVDKNNLSFPILSDEHHRVYKAFNVGRGMLGLSDARTTFVLDSKAIIRDVLSATMNYGGHVKFVTKQLAEIRESESKAADQQGHLPQD